jgi:hypothetical protein
MRARCVDGPYAGQTLEFPFPQFTYNSSGIGPLVWINYGIDKHCYQMVTNNYVLSRYSSWRLIYRDTF